MKTRLSVEEQGLRRSLAWLGYDPGELSGDKLRGVCLELEGPGDELNNAQAVVLNIARYDLLRCRPHGGDEVRCAGCQRPIVDELVWVLDRTLVMHRACCERFESTIPPQRA